MQEPRVTLSMSFSWTMTRDPKEMGEKRADKPNDQGNGKGEKTGGMKES